MSLPRYQLYGIDFTSRPSRRKPITVACGWRDGDTVHLDQLVALVDFASFEALLQTPGPWLAACDFPFGLPQELIAHLGWPQEWSAVIDLLVDHERTELASLFQAFCDGRPAGSKFAHRAVDLLARSSPSMKWVNPPVAWMLREGASRLRDAGVTLAGLHAGDPQRIAVEAYPALAARAVIGNASYKNDAKAKQTPERQARRAEIVQSLLAGRHPLGLRLHTTTPQLADALVIDPSGDLLDASLCLLQASWASLRPHYGLPPTMNPLEGWIVTVPAAAA